MRKIFHDVATFTALKSRCDVVITLRSSCTLVDAVILLLILMASLSESFPRLLSELNDTKDTRKMLGTPTAQRSWTPGQQRLPAHPARGDASDDMALDVIHSHASKGEREGERALVVTTGALVEMMASAGASVKSDAPIPPGGGERPIIAALAAAALTGTGLHMRRIKPRITLL